MLTGVTSEKARIYHVGSRDTLLRLRDDILRLHGFEVVSTLSLPQALEDVPKEKYGLVLIDVEGENRVVEAQQLCDAIKKAVPGQHVAYVCNYRVAIESSCPDEIIRAEFNPEAFVRGVKETIARVQDS